MSAPRQTNVERLAGGIYYALLFIGIFIALVFVLDRAGFMLGRDSTDGERVRSGMRLHIDAATGCEYLSVQGGLFPRLDSHGRVSCGNGT